LGGNGPTHADAAIVEQELVFLELRIQRGLSK
jgi:hypothetical protein